MMRVKKQYRTQPVPIKWNTMRILGGIILVAGTFISSSTYVLTNVDQRSNAETQHVAH